MKELHDYSCERAVLAGIFCDNQCYDTIGLTVDDFSGKANAEIFATIGELLGKGQNADIMAVEARLREKGAKAGAKDLSEIDPMTAANVAFYAGKVREYSKKRKLWKLAEAIIERTNSQSETSADIMEEVERRMTELSDAGQRELKKIGTVLHSALAIIEARYHAKGQLDGLATGFGDLDRLLGGLKPGSLVIIAARPSVGKTALALCMALNMVVKQHIDVGFFSCEMTAEQLAIRAMAGIGRIDSHKISTGWLDASDFSRVTDAGASLFGAPLTIDDTASIELSTLKSRARQMRRLGVKCIFVDYLTLIRHGDARMQRWEKTGEISKSLKNLGRELNIPVVALSQVGREAEGRMPTLANLRMSGEIEEDSDVVIFLHRDRMAGEAAVVKTEVEVAKNRYGATGKLELAFLPKFVQFENMEHHKV